MKIIEQVRATNPLVICLTNDVVKNFTANGLIAAGASPAMSAHVDDLRDLLRHAGALLLNIGTADSQTESLYHGAAELAESYGVPIVLDPVACGASSFRKRIAEGLLTEHKITVLRGNAGEIGALSGNAVGSKGVDSAQADDVALIAQKAVATYGVTTIVTGVTDAIADTKRVCTMHNGSSMMPRVVGTGCLLGGVIAAYIACSGDDAYEACKEAMAMYTVAGELAEQAPLGKLPGHYAVNFIDALYTITAQDIAARVRKEEVHTNDI